MPTPTECWLKLAVDHPAGVFTCPHMRDTDMLRAALRSLVIPSSETACRMELTVPAKPYSAEFTNFRMLPASTVSFSMRSAILANDTSSFARLAIRRFKIGENGGSCPKAMRERSRTVGVPAEAVTFGLSSVHIKSLSVKNGGAGL